MKYSNSYDKVININNNSFSFVVMCPFEFNNPKIELRRYDEFIIKDGQVCENSIIFNFDNLNVVGDYVFNIFDRNKLIAKDLPLRLQKKGFRVKDNH